MSLNKDHYAHIREKLPKLSALIAQAKDDPEKEKMVLYMLDLILKAARQEGGSIQNEVEKVAAEVQRLMKETSDPVLVQKVLEDLMHLRQDTTEL